MTKTLVSVCCVTYNHVDYIKEALDSFLMQKTDFPFEICLGEDESNDGTRAICLEYAEKYPDKIRLFLRTRKDVIYINGRATGRYNFIETLKECQGKYIALCEGDDYWTDPYKLQKQVDLFREKPSISGCVSSGYIQNRSKLHKRYYDYKYKQTIKINDLLFGNPFLTSTSIYKKEILLNNTKLFKVVIAADYAMHLVAAKNGGIGFLSEPMAVYRIHNNSYWSSRNKIDMLKGSIKNCKQLINHVLIEQTYKKKTHKYFIHLHNQLFKELLNHHKFVESIYILIKLFLIQSIDLNLIRKTKDRIFAIFQKIFITGVNRLIF